MLNSDPVIKRLFKYRSAVRRFQSIGLERIFSENIADATRVSAIQVRKDLSLAKIHGNKKAGYRTEELLNDLDDLLGKKVVNEVIVVGFGNIGRALVKYKGFEKELIHIAAAFDINVPLDGQEEGIPILPMDQMAGYIKEKGIRIGILAVPADVAQGVVDQMVEAGIKGVLNFVPISLKIPEDRHVRGVNLRLKLETLIYFVDHAEDRDHA